MNPENNPENTVETEPAVESPSTDSSVSGESASVGGAGDATSSESPESKNKGDRRYAIRQALRSLKKDEVAKTDGSTQGVSASKPATEVATQATPVTSMDDIEAPTAFNSREREAWKKGDRKGIREAYERIRKDATSEVSRAHREYQSTKKLAETIAPYLELSGQRGQTPEQALMHAVSLVTELGRDKEKGFKELAAHIGLDLKNLQAESTTNGDPQISDLQSELKSLKDKLETRELEAEANKWVSTVLTLADRKNNTGAHKYVDFHTGRIPQLERRIGSLLRNEKFRSAVREHIPSATDDVIALEAYKFCGGWIDESTGASTKTQTIDINKARRAGASSPGRSSASVPMKQKGDRRFAIRQAYRELTQG